MKKILLTEKEKIELANMREVLSVSLAAVYIGISESTLRKAIEDEKLPVIKEFGNRQLLFKPVLNEWLRLVTQMPKMKEKNLESVKPVDNKVIRRINKSIKNRI